MRFAFVSCRPIRDSAFLVRAANHAMGRDESSKKRRRKGATGPRTRGLIRDPKGKWIDRIIHPVGHPKAGKRLDGFPAVVDYPRAFKAHLRRNKAGVAKNAHLGLHMIAGVSPEYFDDDEHAREPGDPNFKGSKHDPNAPAVRKLLKVATEWANAELGGAWAARYDVDEDGAAIVDVMCSPIRANKSSGKKWVSIRKAQNELKEKYPYAAKGYGAMQSSWADFASKALGEDFERGIPKKETGREHLIAEEYGAAMDDGRERVAEIEKQADVGKKRLQEIEEQLARAVETRKAMVAKQKSVMAAIELLQAERERLEKGVKKMAKALLGLRNRLGAWALSRYRAASRPELPPDPEHEELAEEAVELAVELSSTAGSDTPVERHREWVEKRVLSGRRGGGWGDDHPEAPLRTAWAADESEREYEDWRLELAHVSARGVDPDHRDLVRLARRVEKELGRYQTRAERRRRRQQEKAARPQHSHLPGVGSVVEGLAEELEFENPNRPRRR